MKYLFIFPGLTINQAHIQPTITKRESRRFSAWS